MDITLVTSEILLTILVFVRVSTFFILLPIINFIKLPVVIRIALSLALSFFLKLNFVESGSSISMNTQYIFMLIFEVVNGMSLAFGVFVAFATFQLAGRIIDFQMGLAVANQIDPITNAQAPLVGTLLFLVGSLVFILEGGISLIIKVLVLGLQTYPPGVIFGSISFEAMISAFGSMLSLSVVLIAPVIVTLFLVDIAMAFSARFMPQLNVFILSIPLKVAIGFCVLAMVITGMKPIMELVFNIVLTYWYGMF
ncbi:MAG: flagellar biosynthetic protein FliR [Cycloclasticus sp.]|jgi:Flagellar biosynthesis pathway, component FliR